jgi:hypothetical protein
VAKKKKAKTIARGKQMRRKMTFGGRRAMGSSLSGSFLAPLSANDEDEQEEEEEEEDEDEEEEEEEEDERKGWSD